MERREPRCTTIMSFRNAALAIGLIAAGALAPKIGAWVPEVVEGATAVDGYEYMGWIVGGIIALSTLWVFFGTARAPFKLATQNTVPLLEQLKIALDEAGLNIPYPQTDVHLHKVSG